MDLDIEKLLREKRDQLDVETPPGNLWDGIEKGIQIEWGDKKEVLPMWIWKAAAVVFLAISTSLFVMLLQEKSVTSELASLGDISESYSRIEKEYIRDVQSIEDELQIKPVHRKEFSWLFEELDYLEVVNTEYRKDLDNHGDKEQVVSALIDYYEKKLKILKRIQLEINRKNNEKDNEVNI